MFYVTSILLIFNAIWIASAKYEMKCPTPCHQNSTSPSTFVKEYCTLNNGTMRDRCCVAGGSESYVIGLDLTDCGLSNVTEIKNIYRPGIHILDVVGNELYNSSKSDFEGFTNLSYLYLPHCMECPGGPDAWDTFFNDSGNYSECYHELNPCQYLNVSCTINGQCIHKGPGAAKCTCLPEHYGYKCLQKGEFPNSIFAIALTLPAVAVSALAWIYLRRNVLAPVKVD